MGVIIIFADAQKNNNYKEMLPKQAIEYLKCRVDLNFENDFESAN